MMRSPAPIGSASKVAYRLYIQILPGGGLHCDHVLAHVRRPDIGKPGGPPWQHILCGDLARSFALVHSL